jgi:hypothetical protein
MDPDSRAARAGRDRAATFRSNAARKAWAARAAKFEQDGTALIDRAMKRPVIKGSQGPQVSPEFRMGMQLLKAADQLWARLGRVGPPDDKPTKAGPGKPRSLAEYRRA